jgi:hypothetical protein
MMRWIEQLHLHGGGGQAHHAGQRRSMSSGGISTRVVVYENEGTRGVNDSGF